MSNTDGPGAEPGEAAPRHFSEWFKIPHEMLEPLGLLAVAAGRLEMMAHITFRAFFRDLHSDVTATLASPIFSQTTRTISDLMEHDAVRTVDPTLPGEWRTWLKDARAIMIERNSLLHGVWPDAGTDGSFTLMNFHGKRPLRTVHVDEVRGVAQRGMAIAARNDFPARIAAVLRSGQYVEGVPSATDSGGAGGLIQY